MRRSTASAEGAELTGQAHSAEREERDMRVKETCADRLAPLGSEREREGARKGELPLTDGVHMSGGAGARPGWADLSRLGCFPFFFFSGFSNSFSISFSIEFSNPNSN
jgi:hypothetical protein